MPNRNHGAGSFRLEWLRCLKSMLGTFLPEAPAPRQLKPAIQLRSRDFFWDIIENNSLTEYTPDNIGQSIHQTSRRRQSHSKRSVA